MALNHAENVPMENMLLPPNTQVTLERQVSTRMTTILNIRINIFFFFEGKAIEKKFRFRIFFLMTKYLCSFDGLWDKSCFQNAKENRVPRPSGASLCTCMPASIYSQSCCAAASG